MEKKPLAIWFFVCGLVFAGLTASASHANVCSLGTAEPPFLQAGVEPNLLLMIDNSASMYDLAYVNAADDASGYCYDDSYASGSSYAGYFDADAWYAYESGRFVKTTAPAACSSPTYKKSSGGADEICLKVSGSTVSAFAAKGNFLNWAASSKMDIEKKILTGGKYDAANGVLVMESRGCLERRFIKKTAFDSGGHLTLAVRPPTAAEKNGTTDNTTRIEIYPVSSTGYNHAACQQAVEEMRSGNPSLGQLKGYIDACMGYESGGGNTPEVASRSAFNHSVQDCWYIAKQGLSQWLQTSGGSITRIQNDCSSVYEALLPWEIGTDHNGYVCYGDYRDPVTAPLAERGYVGRCYYEGSAEIDEVCTDRPCDDKTNKVKPQSVRLQS